MLQLSGMGGTRLIRTKLLVNIVCIIAVFGCGEESGSGNRDNREVILDSESGQHVVVHAESGTTWLACPVGVSWNDVEHRCEGDPALLSWVEAQEACPEGFTLPDRQDYEDVMCELIGGMTEICPNEQYYRCQDCEECIAIFPIFSGVYILSNPLKQEHDRSLSPLQC